ncbi:MAG: hypothetical protein WBX25_28950 [Rhodomicrobium sp.]
MKYAFAGLVAIWALSGVSVQAAPASPGAMTQTESNGTAQKVQYYYYGAPWRYRRWHRWGYYGPYHPWRRYRYGYYRPWGPGPGPAPWYW